MKNPAPSYLSPLPRRLTVAALSLGLLASASACSDRHFTLPDQAASSTPSASATPSPEITANPSPEPSQDSSATSTPTPEASPQDAETPIATDTQPSTETPSQEGTPEATPETTPETSPEATAIPVNDGYVVDAAAITTRELVTGAPLDPTAFSYAAADQPSVVFQSPDNSVACLLQPYGAFCMTDDSVNWVLLSVSMKPGATEPRSIQAQGRAANHEWFATGTPLPEGQSVSWMGMTCTSVSPSSIHCHDGVTGFTLADSHGR